MSIDIENAKKVISVINEETERMQYGRIMIEVTVIAGRASNIQLKPSAA